MGTTFILKIMTQQKNTPNNLADVIGLPDEKDKQNILTIIKNYELQHPGKLGHTIKEAREDFANQGFDKEKFGLVNKSASGRVIFELPQDLAGQITEAYPLMFTDKAHFQWFVKNFKALMIPRIY